MPSHRKTLAALTAGVLALGVANAAPSTATAASRTAGPAPSPCQAPSSGFQACLRVLYQPADDGSVHDVRVTATLLRRVATCPRAAGKREVVIARDDGTRLDSARRPGSCRRGIVTWRTTFSTGETAGWALEQGDTVDSAWSGVRNTASVKLGG